MSPFTSQGHFNRVRRKLSESGREVTPDQLQSEVDQLMSTLAERTGIPRDRVIELLRQDAELATAAQSTIWECLDEDDIIPIPLMIDALTAEAAFGRHGMTAAIVERAIRAMADDGLIEIVGNEIKRK